MSGLKNCCDYCGHALEAHNKSDGDSMFCCGVCSCDDYEGEGDPRNNDGMAPAPPPDLYNGRSRLD